MSLPLMPKATAIWLVENTTLTFDQIANFCGMHPLEVQGIADGDVATGIIGQDPIARGLLTQEGLEAAEKDPEVKLRLVSNFEQYIKTEKKRKSRYTPVARRQDKPDAISWLIKNHPELSDPQIAKLIGTTKSTINSIKERSHWNIQNIKPRDPVLLGLCTQTALHAAVDKAKSAQEIKEKKAQKEKARKQKKVKKVASQPKEQAKNTATA